ncbi:hypothetical protein D3C71_1780110 [compost metagenome]
MVDVCSISVPPSGGALATASMPIMPPAPGLFSMTTGRLQRVCMAGCMMRDMVSPPVPGDEAMMIFVEAGAL